MSRLGETNPEITDHSESNILVVIIGIFSGITETLNYYIDNMAREAFITTARRYSSLVKHTRLIDYRIKAAIPASVDIRIAFLNIDEEPQPITQAFTIPSGTIFKTSNDVIFMTTNDKLVNNGVSVINISLLQQETVLQSLLGQTDGTNDQIFSLGKEYVHNSIYLKVGGEVWHRKDTLGRSTPEDKDYIVEISSDRVAYVRFGDDVNGAKPAPGLDVIADYYETKGSKGNVDLQTINKTDFKFTDYGVTAPKIDISNPLKAVSGSDYESIESIRRSAPLSLRTLEKAVTRQDYIDISKLAPGVDKATVHYECGKYISIYISPNGGGIAQMGLLASVKDFVEERKMITTFIDTQAAGESSIVITINATARFRMDPVVTREDIRQALLDNYSYEASDVNRPIRISDIIALVDNLEKVDYLTLEQVYLIPYMRPKEHHTQILKNMSINPNSKTIKDWTIQYDGNYMRLFEGNISRGNITLGEDYTDPMGIFNINIQDNGYEIGQTWEFKTYPYNENIELGDYSVPILTPENINITVNEQLVNN